MHYLMPRVGVLSLHSSANESSTGIQMMSPSSLDYREPVKLPFQLILIVN